MLEDVDRRKLFNNRGVSASPVAAFLALMTRATIPSRCWCPNMILVGGYKRTIAETLARSACYRLWLEQREVKVSAKLSEHELRTAGRKARQNFAPAAADFGQIGPA